MGRGRRPAGPECIEQLHGSGPAKERWRRILETLADGPGLTGACLLLGIGPRQFHALRTRALQAALESLEPRPLGRPLRNSTPPSSERLAELEAQNRQLRLDLQAARIRVEIALAMPQLLQHSKPLKKTTSRKRPSAQHSKGTTKGTSADSGPSDCT
jgi:hypothetical protein